MTEHHQPSGEVEPLLELCAKSVSSENAGTEMQRFFQLTIWTEGHDFQDFRKIRFFAERQVRHHQLGSVIEGANWGPFEGSWYGAFFSRTNKEMKGEQFLWGMWQVVNDFENKFAAAIEPGTRALLIVGTVAIGLTAAPGAPARPSFSYIFQVPASLASDIIAAGAALNATEQFKKLFPTEASPQPEWVPPPSDEPNQWEIRRLRRRRGWE